MKSELWVALAVALLAPLASPHEELAFRGEIVEVDLEGSLVVVKSRKGTTDVEKLFEVDELTTEIRSYEGSDEPTPIVFSNLEIGDYVEIHYEVVKGRNVATRIVRGRAHLA